MSDGGAQRTRDRYPRAGRRDALQREALLRVRGRSVAWVPPLLLLVVIIAVDVGTPGNFRIITWIVLVPGTAAALCRVWTTAAFALLSVASFVLVDGAWPNEYQAGLADFVLVAIGGILATLACEVRLRGERRVIHMRDVAETTRRTVLRPLPPGWGGLEHAAVHLAADTDARVGGDFYDIQPGPHGTRVLVGDVQGKGLGAVETAAVLLGTFREASYHEPRIATVAERLEIRMRRHRQHLTDLGRPEADRFATAVLLGFPPEEADGHPPGGADEGVGEVGGDVAGTGGDVAGTVVVEAVVFGHEPPLAVGPAGVRALPGCDALPLGLAELGAVAAARPPDGDATTAAPVTAASPLTPSPTPPVHRVPVALDETLLLFTDGVTEARNRDGVFYPLREEVARAVAADPGAADPHRLVALVRDGTLRHTRGHLDDDTTVFAVRRASGAGPEGGRLQA